MGRVGQERAAARGIVRSLRGEPRALAEAALAIVERQQHVAYEVFRASPAAVMALKAREVEGMLSGLHDWRSVDGFGCFVSGVAWREGVLKDVVLRRWARDERVWVRRAALVSTVPLNLRARGATAAKGEAGRTLMICEMLVADREDMVVKALSWALRELASRDAAAVRAFLAEHGGALAARVRRETGNKLRTGRKNPQGGHGGVGGGGRA
jgi:3-methyladenine DNA glycosylase AlkD